MKKKNSFDFSSFISLYITRRQVMKTLFFNGFNSSSSSTLLSFGVLVHSFSDSWTY